MRLDYGVGRGYTVSAASKKKDVAVNIAMKALSMPNQSTTVRHRFMSCT